MPIFFFRTTGSYGCFSNFSKHPTRLYGSLWATTEHAFQGMKFFPHRPDLLKRVQEAATPREAANIGRNPDHPLHVGWDRYPQALSFRVPDASSPFLQPDDGLKHETQLFHALKDLIMYEVIYGKTMQHPDVRSTLLATGSETIVEDSTTDVYWGWGSGHHGENKLGRIWMAVRTAFQRGMESGTAFGKPERVDFVCTPAYPWKPEYGPGLHPDASGVSIVAPHSPGFRCPHCDHYFERLVQPG